MCGLTPAGGWQAVPAVPAAVPAAAAAVPGPHLQWREFFLAAQVSDAIAAGLAAGLVAGWPLPSSGPDPEAYKEALLPSFAAHCTTCTANQMARLVALVLRPWVHGALPEAPLCFRPPACLLALQEDTATWVPVLRETRVLTMVLLLVAHTVATADDARALSRLCRHFTGVAEGAFGAVSGGGSSSWGQRDLASIGGLVYEVCSLAQHVALRHREGEAAAPVHAEVAGKAVAQLVILCIRLVDRALDTKKARGVLASAPSHGMGYLTVLLTGLRLLPPSDEKRAAFGKLETFGAAYCNQRATPS